MTIMMRRLFLQVAALQSAALASSVDYGVDCSFPYHTKDLNHCGGILGDRTSFYQEFYDGCVQAFGEEPCDDTETSRLAKNYGQPQSMINFTKTGFTKVRAPKELMNLLNTHWHEYRNDTQKELWGRGDTAVNHWAVNLSKVDLHMNDGDLLAQKIYDAAKHSVELWTGMEQRPTSLYGIRIYGRGSVLAPHVDRWPLISSVILNVDQDVDEPWPLEVIDRHGKAVNVTMEPGDMVLYESHSLIHGRPFPLNGTFMANVFCHFEPTGRHLSSDGKYHVRETLPPDGGLAPYVIRGSVYEKEWWREFPNGWEYWDPFSDNDEDEDDEDDDGDDDEEEKAVGHQAAGEGDVDKLKYLAKHEPDTLHARDGNGWQPIHEAAREGNLDVVAMLLDHGADMNSATGDGDTPWDLVVDHQGEDHPLATFLDERGAASGDEL